MTDQRQHPNERLKLDTEVARLAVRLGAAAAPVETLWDGANVVLRLGGELVARVATTTARVRGRDAAREAMARSIRVARHLTAAGCTVPRPSEVVDPGPHTVGDTWVTFWANVEHDPGRALDAGLAAERLTQMHQALGRLSAEGFARLGPLEELGPMIERMREEEEGDGAFAPAFADELAACRISIDSLALPEAVIHGDSSTGNLLRTPEGPIWSDFEDACVGPREWDLACLVGTARVFDLPSRRAREEILAAHGAPPVEVLAPFVRARVVQALVWEAAIVRERDEGHAEARARREAWRAWRRASP